MGSGQTCRYLGLGLGVGVTTPVPASGTSLVLDLEKANVNLTGQRAVEETSDFSWPI